MRRLTYALALTTALTLTACGAQTDKETAAAPSPEPSVVAETPESAPTVEVTPTPEPEPTSTVLTREEAGQRYLQLVEPWNAGVPEWTAALDAEDVPRLRELAAANADKLRTFVDGLIETEWPENVQPAVDRLITENAADISAWAAAGASRTDEEFWQALNTLGTAGSAQEVRALLGIDAVPVG